MNPAPHSSTPRAAASRLAVHAARRVLAMGALICGVALSPALAADAQLPVAQGTKLVLPLPEGWRASQVAARVPTLSIKPEEGADFELMVSAMEVRSVPSRETTDAKLSQIVESAAKAAAPQAVETSLPIHELNGPNVRGKYFSATDRAPGPGEYTYMTQGALAVQGVLVSFTVLSNGEARAAVKPALQMMKGARRE